MELFSRLWVFNQIKKQRRIRKTKQKPAVSSKRYVVAVKVFVTPEEKNQLEMRSKKGDFTSVSNLIRHHLGLSLNETGRRKQIPKDFFNKVSVDEIEKLFKEHLG